MVLCCVVLVWLLSVTGAHKHEAGGVKLNTVIDRRRQELELQYDRCPGSKANAVQCHTAGLKTGGGRGGGGGDG